MSPLEPSYCLILVAGAPSFRNLISSYTAKKSYEVSDWKIKKLSNDSLKVVNQTYPEVINGQLQSLGLGKFQGYLTIHVIVVAQVNFHTVVSYQSSNSTIIVKDFRGSWCHYWNQTRREENCQDGKILQDWTLLHGSRCSTSAVIAWIGDFSDKFDFR